MVGLLIVLTVSIMFLKVRSKFLRFSVSMTLFVGLGAAYYQGWEKLEPRLMSIFSDNMSSRTQLYETTLKMIDDYGKFGSGPGSFEAITQFELGGILSRWESWAHNDYLEFYLTFGKAGGSLMCCTLFFLTVCATLILLFKPLKTMTWFGLMSLLGVGIHAAGDFPLQTLSILIPVCILLTLLTVSQKYADNTASTLV